jgi:hypothetical protein
MRPAPLTSTASAPLTGRDVRGAEVSVRAIGVKV